MNELDLIKEAFNILYKKAPIIFSIIAIPIIFFRKELTEAIKYLIKWYLQRRGERISKALEPTKHPFFNYMNKCINITIPNIVLENQNKEKILKEFLIIKFSTFKDNFKIFVDNINNYEKITTFELQTEIMKIFDNSINEYNQKAKQRFQELNINESQINYIIQTFDKWHEKTVNIIGNAVQEACINPFLSSNQERISQVLDYLKLGFKITIQDGVKAFSSMNGKLENIKIH